jgi:anti-anti-sigma factor
MEALIELTIAYNRVTGGRPHHQRVGMRSRSARPLLSSVAIGRRSATAAGPDLDRDPVRELATKSARLCIARAGFVVIVAAGSNTPGRVGAMGSGTGVWVVVDGELDVASVAPLRELLWRLRDQHAVVVLDLAGVTFMDSSGVELLWRAADDAASGGWQLWLTAPSSEVVGLLDLTGVSSRMAYLAC